LHTSPDDFSEKPVWESGGSWEAVSGATKRLNLLKEIAAAHRKSVAFASSASKNA